MAGFDVFSARDLIALIVIGSRSVGKDQIDDPARLVADAFKVADEFTAHSEGRWSDSARHTHEQRRARTTPAKK